MCESCGSPLAVHQRYCLSCGRRIGSRSPRLEELLSRVVGRARPADATAQSPAAVESAAVENVAQRAPAAAGPARGWMGASALRLPAPRISALLVLVFLGFGVLLGNVAATRPSASLASARSPLKVVLPSSEPAVPSTSTSASAEPSSTASSEPPAAESEPTPAAAPAAASPTTSTTAPSSSKGSSEASEGAAPKPAAGSPAKKLPPIKHVFVIMLSDQPYAAVFGPSSAAPYLAGTLEHHGELLVHYDAVAHEELANEVALLSGQGPTAETAANCPNYTDIIPASVGADEQVLGSGCVYPQATQTLPGQLAAKHLSWRAYVQGTDEGGTPGACAHPALGQADPTAAQGSGSGPYATFRNPFVYFQSLVGSPACAADDVGLGQLSGDLVNAKRTPSFSYIVPSRCRDANPTPCTAGAPAGPAQADTFLRQVVPKILASPAYKESGLLVISVDEAPSSGEFADSSACCGQPAFPNVAASAPSGLSPRGGGSVGALLLSPYVKGGETNQEPFNHFSLLRTIEDLFGLGHLGYAGLSAVKPFEPSMFTAGKS
jgi:hypothetical protein